MQFVGREKELETLTREYERESGFVVIYGRRRVGKTRLIKEFIKDKNALYFLATESMERTNLNDFMSLVAEFIEQPVLATAKLESWQEIFKLIADYKPNEKKIIVIDELPYIAKVNPAFPSIMQYVWDEILKPLGNVMLILCGSYISMMEKYTLVYSSPLYGRRTSQIKLKPLSFSLSYKGDNFEKRVEDYAITGGVPQYIEFFENQQDSKRIIAEQILSTTGYFYNEPAFLMKDEVKETTTYYSIIETIAKGNHKIGHIASVLEVPTNTLSPYLETLVSLGFVEKRVPVTEEKPEKSKKGLYFISDNFIKFWFEYVFPNKSYLEMENLEPVFEQMNKNFKSNFVAFAYEDLCKEIFIDLWKTKQIDFSPSKIGSYWNNNTEIDVVCVDNQNKQVFFGECKYHEKPVGLDVLNSLKAKVEETQEIENAYKGYKFIFGIFSKSGFEDSLLEQAKENSNIWLIDQDKILR